MDPDDAVRSTNDDALVSKLSAVNTGYIQDPFATQFLKRSQHQKRSPLLNRGTYLRCTAIDRVVAAFIRRHGDCQVVSFGAGCDSRFLNLKVAGSNPRLYIEIDFPQITARKAQSLVTKANTKHLIDPKFQIGNGGCDLVSSDYVLLGCDLRHFKSSVVHKLVSETSFTASLPTLFISECFLIYLDPQHSIDILTTCASMLADGCEACFVVYEQIEPNDRFGKVMLDNLASRGIQLKGIQAFPTLQSQIQRFISTGWQNANAITLKQFWYAFVGEDEKMRLDALEPLDEVEEWNLILSHYCLSLASTSTGSLEDFWRLS